MPSPRPPADSRAASENMGGFIGALLQDYVLEAVARLRPVAEEAGLTLAEMALAWVLRREEVASAIAGASRPEQVYANAAASGVQLSPTPRRRSTRRSATRRSDSRPGPARTGRVLHR